MAKKVVPCEYCDDELITILSDKDESLMIEIYPGKMICAIAFFRNPNDEELEEGHCEIPMSFCPNCGRRLN